MRVQLIKGVRHEQLHYQTITKWLSRTIQGDSQMTDRELEILSDEALDKAIEESDQKQYQDFDSVWEYPNE